MSHDTPEWLHLVGDERVVWTGQPRLLGYAWTLLTGILLIPVLGLGLVVLAWQYLHVQHTTFVITTDRVVHKTGIVSRTVTDLGHAKIQDTGYRQSVVGRYYGFGTVEISTAGSSGVELQFSHVDDPLAVQERLDEIGRGGSGSTGRDGVTRETASGERSGAARLDVEALSELAAELRGTREALEAIERSMDDDRG